MFLTVDRNHQLYIERHGNVNGPSFLFLHGGPGLGCTARDLEFFDLNQCNVILMDQRGCGQSIAKNLLESNTSIDLVLDGKMVLDHFDIKKVHLFGGSWGSSLAVLFALNFPERTSSLILRGLFLASKMERRGFEQGEYSELNPSAWESLHAMFSNLPKDQVFDAYVNGILGESDISLLTKHFLGYGRNISDASFDLDEWWDTCDQDDMRKKALIMAHYSKHNFFLPDNYLWDSLHLLECKKVHLIHGVHDRITDIKFAKLFAEICPQCTLEYTEGGHFSFDPPNFDQLIKTIKMVL